MLTIKNEICSNDEKIMLNGISEQNLNADWSLYKLKYSQKDNWLYFYNKNKINKIKKNLEWLH